LNARLGVGEGGGSLALKKTYYSNPKLVKWPSISLLVILLCIYIRIILLLTGKVLHVLWQLIILLLAIRDLIWFIAGVMLIPICSCRPTPNE